MPWCVQNYICVALGEMMEALKGHQVISDLVTSHSSIIVLSLKVQCVTLNLCVHHVSMDKVNTGFQGEGEVTWHDMKSGFSKSGQSSLRRQVNVQVDKLFFLPLSTLKVSAPILASKVRRLIWQLLFPRSRMNVKIRLIISALMFSCSVCGYAKPDVFYYYCFFFSCGFLLALWWTRWTSDLFGLYPASLPMSARFGSSHPWPW